MTDYSEGVTREANMIAKAIDAGMRAIDAAGNKGLTVSMVERNGEKHGGVPMSAILIIGDAHQDVTRAIMELTHKMLTEGNPDGEAGVVASRDDTMEGVDEVIEHVRQRRDRLRDN